MVMLVYSENVQFVILNKTLHNYWLSPTTAMGGLGAIFMVFRQKIMAFIIHCNYLHQNILYQIFKMFAVKNIVKEIWL